MWTCVCVSGDGIGNADLVTVLVFCAWTSLQSIPFPVFVKDC